MSDKERTVQRAERTVGPILFHQDRADNARFYVDSMCAHRWVEPINDEEPPRSTECPGCHTTRHVQHNDGPERFVAVDCPAWINGKDVLLAVQKDADPTARKVIAMFPDEARWLWNQGRLTGWTPMDQGVVG